MPAIAIVGAGPGMGVAIARTFGARGFDVALLARTKVKLDAFVDQLGAEGITAAAFPADVLDSSSLTAALDAARDRFDGALAATRAVLPVMREAGAGTLLFTTGGGSVDPVPMFGNVNAAGAALRNWVLNLDNELAGTGVHAAHVAINVWIGDGGPEGIPMATPEQIAPVYWDLHEQRDRAETVFNA